MPPEGREMKCVGLEVHKKYIYGTVLDERGRVMKRGKFEYTRNGFEADPRVKQEVDSITGQNAKIWTELSKKSLLKR